MQEYLLHSSCNHRVSQLCRCFPSLIFGLQRKSLQKTLLNLLLWSWFSFSQGYCLDILCKSLGFPGGQNWKWSPTIVGSVPCRRGELKKMVTLQVVQLTPENINGNELEGRTVRLCLQNSVVSGFQIWHLHLAWLFEKILSVCSIN